jgi:hypothetical protein
MRDRGSMMVLTVLVGTAFTAAVLIAVEPVLGGLVDRQRARAAADAAALAGVTDGRDGASALATANGGTIVAWSESGDEVTVTVEVGGQRALARATDAP